MIGNRRNIVARGGNPYALEFDGTNYVDTGFSPLTTGVFSFTAWFHLYNNTGIIGIHDPDNDARIQIGAAGGGIRAAVGDTFSTDSSVKLNEWVFLCVVARGTEYDVYKNGEIIATHSYIFGSTDFNLFIGARNEDGAGVYVDGIVDEVRFYDSRVLDKREIKLLSRGVPISKKGLVGHWNFNEGQGDIAHDISGNGNDGTLVGNPTWTTDTPL